MRELEPWLRDLSEQGALDKYGGSPRGHKLRALDAVRLQYSLDIPSRQLPGQFGPDHAVAMPCTFQHRLGVVPRDR